jgi:hypothetical protein
MQELPVTRDRVLATGACRGEPWADLLDVIDEVAKRAEERGTISSHVSSLAACERQEEARITGGQRGSMQISRIPSFDRRTDPAIQ